MEEGEYDELAELMFEAYGTLHDGTIGAETRGDGLLCHETRILCCLKRVGRMSPSKIADLLGLSRPQMSLLADGLARRRLIERKRDEADRRIVWIRITPAGEVALRGAIAAVGSRIRVLLYSLPPAEIMGIKASLERFASALGGEGT